MRSPLLAAIGGIVAVWALLYVYPRHDPLANAPYTLDRQSAVAAARAEADRQGIEVSDWDVALSTDERSAAVVYASAEGHILRADHYAPPVKTDVLFRAADGERSLLVELDGRGQLVGFRRRQPQPKPKEGTEAEAPPRIPAEVPADVSQALARLTGGDAAFFKPAAPPSAGASQPPQPSGVNITTGSSGATVRNRTIQYHFRADSLSNDDVTLEATVDWLDDEVSAASLDATFSDAYRARDEDWITVGTVILLLLSLAAGLLGIVFYIVGWVNGEIRHRKMLLGLCWIFAVTALFYFWGAAGEAKKAEDSPGFVLLLEYSVTVLFLGAPVVMAIWGAGFMFAVRSAPRRLVDLDLLLRARILSRPVGRAVAVGLGAGAWLALFPLLFAETGLGKSVLSLPDTGAWTIHPVLSSLTPFQRQGLTVLALLFGFLYPMAECYVRRPWIYRPLAVLLAGCGMLGPVFDSASPVALLAVVPGALLIEQVYRRAGFLAFLTCVWATGPLMQSAAMLSFSSVTLRDAGASILWLLAAGLAAALAVASFGRRVPVEDQEAQWKRESEIAGRLREAERERLLSEFSVARRAQELMLPASAPQVSGFEVSASCQPASEVGGDLYDFCYFNGHLGAVVADVSGKGVPAALYMTLTKGLLHSVSRHVDSPGDIVRELNEHLHACAGRNVFVTLVMASMRPDDGSVQCVRAGHNPILWYQAAESKGRYLHSSGIGLGLAGDRLFRRSLAVESIHMAPHDLLVLYSDGITEAMNARGDEYGEDRLHAVIESHAGAGAHDVREAILQDVRAFVGRTPQHDDMTLIVVRRGSARPLSKGAPESGDAAVA